MCIRDSIETHPDEIELIRACLHSGTPLGNDQFKKKIESAVGMHVGHSKRGRPAVIDDFGVVGLEEFRPLRSRGG